MFKRKVVEQKPVESVTAPTPLEAKEEELKKEEAELEETEEITEEKVFNTLIQHEQRLQAIESALLRIRGAI